MNKWPQNISILKKPRFIPLRYRFIFMISGVLIILLGTLALLLGFLQSRTIQNQIERRGLGIAQSLAATSTADLTTYNYINLERTANQAALNPDIEYVIFHDKEGRVAGYSGRPDLQNRFLEDEVSRQAIVATSPLIQKRIFKSRKVSGLDFAIPVFLPSTGNRWGTIRLGLSLAPMRSQIRQTQWIILGVGLFALVVGILVSVWAAHRVTSPLGNLVHATLEAARGNLAQDVSVETGDEVEILASNFSKMVREILDHRKQLELQLSEIEHLHRYTEKLLTTMSDGLLSVNMNGTVATNNPAVYSILGVSDDRLKAGIHVSNILSEASGLLAYIQEMLDLPETRSPREITFDDDGTVKTLLVGSSVLADESGEPNEIIINLHDITELKELEIRFRQAERLAALGTLAAGLSHEIRNPLSAIKTFVQLLPRKIERPGFMEKFQRTVPREINRINQLIEDLLDLAKPPKYHFAKTDVRNLLEQTIDFLDPELKSHNIQCEFKTSVNLPHVEADAEQLVKAFQNLIHNAAQAMPAGGDLTIEAYYKKKERSLQPISDKQNGSITIVFQDTGSGISEDARKNIFNPFFTTKDKGTGLGLAITHKVITEHGGRIEVASSDESGTRFTVGLPIHVG